MSAIRKLRYPENFEWVAQIARKIPRLGENQLSVLRSMLEWGGWERMCGWVWDTPSGTEKILVSLERHGLVKRHGPVEWMPAWDMIEEILFGEEA
jgi:hypothetical protein